MSTKIEKVKGAANGNPVSKKKLVINKTLTDKKKKFKNKIGFLAAGAAETFNSDEVPHISEALNKLYAGATSHKKGDAILLDHPQDKGTKIIMTAVPVSADPNNDKIIVTKPVVSQPVPFEQWPEEAQRNEYNLFMEKVNAYVKVWPASVEWPTFEDFLDRNVRDSANEELNIYIASSLKSNPAGKQYLQHEDELAERNKLLERRQQERRISSLGGADAIRPAHYGGADNPYEVIKVLEAWGIHDFCVGNTIKYLARNGKKYDGVDLEIEELKKAEFYLHRKIEQKEKARESLIKSGVNEFL